jgi:peptidoglycan/LPS O-acetylase OafA/YrhL
MSREIRSLTGLRGAAAVLVMIYHFLGADPFFAAYTPAIVAKGYMGVDVFFVLSGFVISLSYSRGFAHAVTLPGYANFIVKRLARIYPLYIFMLMVFFLKYEMNLGGHWVPYFKLSDFAAGLVLIQAWGFGFTTVAGIAWSLSTEFGAYLAFPFLARVVSLARPLAAAFLAAGCLGTVALVAFSGRGVVGPMDVVATDSVLPLVRCIAGFGLGMVCYRLYAGKVLAGFLSSSWVLPGLLLAGVIGASLGAHDLALYMLIPPLVLVLAYESSACRALFANRWAYHLGEVSYSLYLVHTLFMPVEQRMEPVLDRFLGPAAHVFAFLIVVATSWALSVLLHRYVEGLGKALFNALRGRPGVQGANAG